MLEFPSVSQDILEKKQQFCFKSANFQLKVGKKKENELTI